MAAPVKITRFDFDPAGLRREARRASSVAASRRMLALALVLEGVTRTEAAQAAGMERQTLRDWVHRYDEDGLAGLADRPGEFGPKRFLSPEQEAEVAEMVRRGPVLAEHGVVRWRRADLARAIEVKFGVVLAERSISTVLRRRGFRRLVARPRHPGQDAAGFCRDKPMSVSCVDGRGWYDAMIEALRKVIKRTHYPLEVMLTCVRWYVAYPLSLRQIEEIMAERGVFVDHATVHRWALKIIPVLAKVFRGRKRSVGKSWRMDETYIKVRGRWRYLYRAVDRDGDTVDFLLTSRRDEAAARRFLGRATDRHGEPEKITIDKSGANTAAIDSYNTDHTTDIELRQCKYLNNIVEQDHRAIKRVTRPMLGFKSLRCARILLAGIETMHMIRKGQLASPNGTFMSAAEQFYSLAY